MPFRDVTAFDENTAEFAPGGLLLVEGELERSSLSNPAESTDHRDGLFAGVASLPPTNLNLLF